MTRILMDPKPLGIVAADMYNPNVSVDTIFDFITDLNVEANGYFTANPQSFGFGFGPRLILLSMYSPILGNRIRLDFGTDNQSFVDCVLPTDKQIHFNIFTDQDGNLRINRSAPTSTSLMVLYNLRVYNLSTAVLDPININIESPNPVPVSLSGGGGALKVEIQNPNTGVTP